ncbi:DUF3592 domain-containing protein [Mycobacterium asiaticum]|uniref:DUF3592 domain-containing protein n=1 Tax=Mycobacterium asiaticum TaxID=1790 RepID=A0A1A3L2A5_MYCAS|nr:DUF3592 domain-containing protein [Mycobacterium asiaticum]OBJ90743.1 hypothetical protein A5640_24105 [Mycobacterium asiaticum]
MKGEWLYLVAGAAMVLLGAWRLVKIFVKFQVSRSNRAWPTVPGHVTRSETVDTGEEEEFRVEYRYEVNGVRHYGDVLQVGHASASRAKNRALLQQYPAGTEVEVHYDPVDPSTAVLIPGGGRNLLVPIAAMLVLIGGGIWISYGAVQRHLSREAEETQAAAALPQVPFYELNAPGGVAIDAQGYVYVCDGPAKAPSRTPGFPIGPPGIPGFPTTTPAIPGFPGPPAFDAPAGRLLRLDPGLLSATNQLPRVLGDPDGIALDSAGNFYITDRGMLWVYSVEHRADQHDTKFTGATPLRGVSSGSVAVDAAGNAYVTELSSGRVLKMAAETKTATEVFKVPDNGSAVDVAVGPTGIVYVTDARGNRVFKIPVDGTPTPLPFPELSQPQGVAVDGAGTVYVVDGGHHRVMKLTANAPTATDLLLEGLVDPYDVAVDNAGNVFVTDRGGHRVLKFPPAQ